MKILLLIMLLLTKAFCVEAEKDGGLTVVAVGEATVLKSKMLFLEIDAAEEGGRKKALDFKNTIKNDFSFYQNKFAIQEWGSSKNINYDEWQKQGAHYSIFFQVKTNLLSIKLFDVKNKKEMYSENISLSTAAGQTAIHKIADQIYRSIMHKPSIFNSKIVFVSDRDSKTTKGGNLKIKEVYMMNFDGRSVIKLTNDQGIAISPSISHDGRYLIYSSLSYNNKNILSHSIKLLDMETKTTKDITPHPGSLNSGAVFHPHNSHLFYYTYSNQGNADIYEYDWTSKAERRITNHFGQDVDPSFNEKGDMMTFLSDRSGKPMIYTLAPDGLEKNIKRISFVGRYNSSPSFSPDGLEIVFSAAVGNDFDIYRIGADQSNLVRLTSHFGSNENPTFSNDGEFIVFSSKRVLGGGSKAVQNLYISTREGEILGPITDSFGNTSTPKWVNY